jgi:hypothetical protein
LEKLIMTRTKLIARTLLTSFALFNLSTAPKATAAPIIVNREPHGAAFIVNSETIPADLKSLLNTSKRSFPALMIRGSHGASFVTATSAMKSDKQAVAVPPLVTRGSHGAAIIAN